jgi:NTE family protein
METRPRVISLALQGGGSHGALTWGVLDRLLEDERIGIDGVSGASAGAINAAVLAHGLMTAGRQGARRALAEFWTSVAAKMPSPLVESLVFLARFLSPSQFNPLNLNPLRDILAAQIDFARLRAESATRLFIAATNVRTGMPRVFRTQEITADVVLASACLPWIHRTVEIDGEAYWDGGLSANPPVRPLLYECEARDIVLVLLQPARRPSLPVTADGIWSRLTEMSFTSALHAELEGIALAKREAERSPWSLGRLERKLRRLNLHRICAPEATSMQSRLDTRSVFMRALFDAGRAQADAWLTQYESPAAPVRAIAPVTAGVRPS